MPAAFLRQIKQNAGSFLRDLAKRIFQLSPAIAPLGGEDVAGKALRMYAHQRRFAGGRAAVLNRYRFFSLAPFDAYNRKFAETRRKFGPRDDARPPGFFSWLHGRPQVYQVAPAPLDTAL